MSQPAATTPLSSRMPMLAGSLLLAALTLGIATDAPAQAIGGELSELTWIGFRQLKDVSQVFVRTTEPIKYRVEKAGDNKIILVLHNTTIPLANNRRPLDTRYFDSAVRYIETKVIEAPSPSVQVEILLRGAVPYAEKQVDNELTISFQRAP